MKEYLHISFLWHDKEIGMNFPKEKKKTISISHYQLIYTNIYVHACIVGETNLQGGNGSANHHKQTDGLASKPTH